MPEREARFAVNAPPQEVWRFVRDIESLCACIPGVEKVVLLDANSADITVKEKIGVVPMILTLRTHIDAEEPPHHLRATAKAEHLTMEIDLALHDRFPRTEMVGQLKVRGEGQLKAVVNSLFERRATERTAQFAAALEQRFGAASAEATAPAVPAAGAPGVLAWLRRLWRWLTSSS